MTLGRWGEELAKLVEEKGNSLDRLTMLAARRSDVRQTVFIATHEPTRANQKPRITRVTKLAERPDGVLVRVDASDFTDYAAVRFGPDQPPAASVEPCTIRPFPVASPRPWQATAICG